MLQDPESFIWKIVHTIHAAWCPFSKEELFQIGYVAYLDHTDADSGYLYLRIRGAMLDALRKERQAIFGTRYSTTRESSE